MKYYHYYYYYYHSYADSNSNDNKSNVNDIIMKIMIIIAAMVTIIGSTTKILKPIKTEPVRK